MFDVHDSDCGDCYDHCRFLKTGIRALMSGFRRSLARETFIVKRTGSLFRFLFAFGVILAGIMSPLVATIASAQGAQTFQSPMTGMTIQATGPWTIETDSVLSEDGIESITVMGQYEFMQVWFMPGGIDLVEARDVILDSYATTFGSFVEIDRGAYGNVSYSLDMTNSEGIEFGVFSLFLGQRDSGFVEYYVYFGAVPTFASGFASAQQNVTVGGTAVFGGVDGTGLQNLLVANAGVTGASTQTQAPPPTQVPNPQPTQPPVSQPTQPPVPQPTQATDPGPASNDGAAYISAIEAELSYINGGAIDLVVYMSQMSGPEAETAISQIDVIAKEWAAYPDRAALIVAPPGYEAVDAKYRELVTEVSAIGVLWDDMIAAAQNGDPAFETLYTEFVNRVSGLVTYTIAVSTAIEEQGGTGQTQTDVPAPAPTEASVGPTEEPVAGSSDGDAYLATIAAEAESLEESLGLFNEGLQLLSSEDAQEQEVGAQQLSDVLNYWGTYPDVASGIVAPAGYEDVDAAYRDLASVVPDLATLFVAYLESEDATLQDEALADFSTTVSEVQTLLADLNAMLDTAGTSTATTGTTETPVETPEDDPVTDVPTEEPEVSEDPTEETVVNTTETGGRGQLPPDPGEEPGEERSGTTRTSGDDFEDLGLLADDEYVSPQFDVDVLWDDRWEFDPEGAEEPIFSDTDAGLDSITLVWTGGDAGDITVMIGNQTGFTPDDNVDYWQSDEYFDQLGVSGEVLLAESGTDRGAVMLLLDAGDGGVVHYREAVCLDRDCSQWAIVSIFATIEDAEDLIADAEEGIEVGGDSATDVFSQREIRRALDN
jgi:hypothetical protein